MIADGKRRAVYTVLSEFLEGDDLWLAMWRWQEGYADKSQFELNSFLSECRDIAAVALNRPLLYRQLIGILMDSKAVLKADPKAEMDAYRTRQLSTGAVEPQSVKPQDWSQTFTMVLRDLFAQLRSDTARAVKGYAVEQASRHRIAPGFVYSFTLWDLDKRLDVNGVALTDLKKLLNYIYIGLCEALGPVEADRILGSVVASVAQAIAAGKQGYPDPRLLLKM